MPEIIIDLPPSFKSSEVEAVINKIFGRSRIETIENKSCVSCDATNVSLADEESAKEYSISGMCQTCQDSTFGE